MVGLRNRVSKISRLSNGNDGEYIRGENVPGECPRPATAELPLWSPDDASRNAFHARETRIAVSPNKCYQSINFKEPLRASFRYLVRAGSNLF